MQPKDAFYLLLVVFNFCVIGCDAPIKQFDPNHVYSLTLARTRSVDSNAASNDVSLVVDQWFGTPNEPRWPRDLLDDETKSLIDSTRLIRAAGPISSLKDGTHIGLYREHCVGCHGLAGGGNGPASQVQNPYPRDFRKGVFKWKSTERFSRPTRDDLKRVLHQGIPGTSMPSFKAIDDKDIEALIDYVIYLSIRGGVERQLVAAAIDELGYEDTRPNDPELQLVATSNNGFQSEAGELAVDVLNEVAQSWADASAYVATVPAPSKSTKDSIEQGRELFHGQIANCVGCHGPSGNGEAITLDYDDWVKEYTTLIGITPTDRDSLKPFRSVGAARPRQIHPRKITDGVYRGGEEEADLYRRITQGIAGTPMPGIEITNKPSGKGLTKDQVWSLVHYLRSLHSSL